MKNKFDTSTFELCTFPVFREICKEHTNASIKEACYILNPASTKFLEKNGGQAPDYRKYLYELLSAKTLDKILKKERKVVTNTENLILRKTSVSIYETIRPISTNWIDVEDGDEGVWVRLTFFDFLQKL